MNVISHALISAVLLVEIQAQNSGGCQSKTILPDSIKRGTSNVSKPGQQFVSDDAIIDGWYSVAAGTRLATNASELKIGSCGTLFPIWLNGTHPSITGETLTVTACMKTYFDVCHSLFPVQIMNCGTHYTYYLKQTDVNSAFCIENSGGCQSKTILPDSIKRGTSNVSKPGQQFVSDDAIIDGWYSVAAGTRLATNASELKIGSCGTLFPIWLNGTHPSITGETLTVTACMKTYFDVCHSPFPVQIINCGTHYTYYLKHTDVNSAFCIEIIGGTSENTMDVSTPLALYSTPTAMAIITTDFRGATLRHPGNATYFGDDSARKLESILKTTTIVFSAVILCPMTVLLVAFLFKLKKRKTRLMKVRDQEKEMPVFFIPTSNGWMKAEEMKIKSLSEPLVVTDLETIHCSRKNKEMS